DAAKLYWVSQGIDTSALDGVRIRIADLNGAMIGQTVGHTVYIDINAAGHGWFVVRTPLDSSEFAGSGPAGIDLVSTVAHEFGHVLGYGDADSGVMTESLADGVRTAALDGLSDLVAPIVVPGDKHRG